MLLRAKIVQITRKLEMHRPSAEFRRRKELWVQVRAEEQMAGNLLVSCWSARRKMGKTLHRVGLVVMSPAIRRAPAPPQKRTHTTR